MSRVRAGGIGLAALAYLTLLAPAAAGMTIAGHNLAIGTDIHLRMAVDDPVAGSSLTAVLFMGDVNATEPSEWYVLHWGPNETLAVAGHDVNQSVAAQWGQGYNVTFARLGTEKFACNFVAAVATTWDGGRVVLDASPAGAEDLASAWDLRGDCREPEMQIVDESKDSPAPLLLPALMVALIMARARARAREGGRSGRSG